MTTPATVLNAIAEVFTEEDDWQPLSTRYRLASAVVEALLHRGYRIVPVGTDDASPVWQPSDNRAQVQGHRTTHHASRGES